eukprot:scaffold4515_cov57-Phaeocystis_antarctica.AAC.1
MASVTRPSGPAPGNADELNAKGLECNQRGDTRGALALFLQAHELRPADARFVRTCADTCPRGLRTVRTGYSHQAPAVRTGGAGQLAPGPHVRGTRTSLGRAGRALGRQHAPEAGRADGGERALRQARRAEPDAPPGGDGPHQAPHVRRPSGGLSLTLAHPSPDSNP